MLARHRLMQLDEKFDAAILRADVPNDNCLLVHVDPSRVKEVCAYLVAERGARYVITIGVDDRPFSGGFLVVHDFAFDTDRLLCSVIASLPAEDPRIASISDVIPAANWAEREMRELVGIEPVGHPYPKRL